MPNSCSQHKKDVAGITDMNDLATQIGDLHYETLAELMEKLSTKLDIDSQTDEEGERAKLAASIKEASNYVHFAAVMIDKAWQISKPFMR